MLVLANYEAVVSLSPSLATFGEEGIVAPITSIGVGNAVSNYLDGKTATIAILKCVGAPGALVFRIYLLQILVLALAGVGIGLIAGAALPALALWALEGTLPLPTVAGIYPGPLLLAGMLGMLTAVTFALWPLARAREVAPGSLFRAVVAPSRARPRTADAIVVGMGVVVELLAVVDGHMADVS